MSHKSFSFVRITTSAAFILGSLLHVVNNFEKARSSNFILAKNYLFEVNDSNTKKRCEISSKLTINTAEQHQ